MPPAVVDVGGLDGALSGGVLPSAGAVVVVVSDGRGDCITVVKSDPVINETWFGASVGSGTSSAPDVRWRASRSAAPSDPGANLITVLGVVDALPEEPTENPTADNAVRTSRAWPGAPDPLNTCTVIWPSASADGSSPRKMSSVGCAA